MEDISRPGAQQNHQQVTNIKHFKWTKLFNEESHNQKKTPQTNNYNYIWLCVKEIGFLVPYYITWFMFLLVLAYLQFLQQCISTIQTPLLFSIY